MSEQQILLSPAAARGDKLSWATRIAYGGGDTACNVVFGMIGTVLTLFYTDYVGISIATVGLVMLISRLFDGVSDVIMGLMVERTNSRWGKSRPWLLWMSVPYAVSAILLFTVPQTTGTLQFLYLLVAYNFCTTVCYTAINLPYGSLSAMMTRASWERDMLSITRMSMSPFGRILAVACTLPLVKYFGDDQAAWIKTMSIWAFLALLLLLFCFYTCEEKVVLKAREQQGNVPVSTQLSALFRNQYFWASAILWTAQSVYYTVVGIALPYYCRYVLGDDTFYSSIFVAETACIIIFTFLSSVPIRKYGKRNVALCGIVLATIGQVLFMFNSDDYHWALANAIIRGIGFAPLNAVLFGFCGDAVEFGQWKTRVRQEGMIFSAGSVGTKLGAGIAAAVISGLLSMAGYVSSSSGSGVQPQSAIDMINHVYLYGSFFLWIVVIITLLFYRLDKQYPQIMHDLKEREARGEM